MKYEFRIMNNPAFNLQNSFIYLLYLYLAIQKFKCSRILVFQYVNERFASRDRTKYPSLRCNTLEIPISRHCLVENIGVEPMTSCVQGRRSSQLS